MDFDPAVFDRDEIKRHLADLGVLYDHDLDELLKRTTQNTRSGNEFGFKPVQLAIGINQGRAFYEGRSFMVEKSGRHPYSTEEKPRDPLPSSFWIRFGAWMALYSSLASRPAYL